MLLPEPFRWFVNLYLVVILLLKSNGIVESPIEPQTKMNEKKLFSVSQIFTC